MTLVPVQIFVAVAPIDKDGITDVVTFIEIVFDVADAADAVVNTQEITSPFKSELLENVLLLLPTLVPFFFH